MPSHSTPALPSHLLSLLLFLLLSSSPLPSSSARCHKADKQALLSIKTGLGNPYIIISWDQTANCCDWNGVTCDPLTNRVTGLDLFADNVSGQIPPSIGDLTSLTSLTFHKLVNLTGPIPPSISKLTNLTFLRLDWNELSGPVPSFLSKLTSLDYLNLAFNKLSGSIPAVLATLPLGFIRLDRNMLTGSIPDALASSPSQYLYLSHNQLTGPIPRSFARAGFETVDLSRNRLTGDASLLFGASKKLRSLDLSRNLFEFDLTAVKLPEGLVWLDINHNKIYGSIPKEITKLELQNLNVSYNRLCGEIPGGGSMGRFDEYSFFHNKCLCGPPLAACK